MANTDVFAFENSGLSEFLFAAVGLEANGMTLSVMSVFARRGNDPWREAGRLAGLSRPDAIDSLAQTIAGLPTGVLILPDATAIATRLVALLPRRSGTAGPSPPVQGPDAMRGVRMWVLLASVALALASTLGLFRSHVMPAPDSSVIDTVPSGAPASPELRKVP